MFSECSSLAMLNAMRAKKIQEGADVVEVNNCYNARRKEILASRSTYVQLNLRKLVPETAQTYAGLPIAGTSESPGQIKVTMQGILI